MRYSPEATAEEAVALIEKIAGKRRDKVALNAALAALRSLMEAPMCPRRLYNIWRKDAKPEAFEMDALRAAAGIVQEASDELSELRARVAKCEALLAVSDADFGGPHVDALRQSMGGEDRAVDRGLGRASGLEGAQDD